MRGQSAAQFACVAVFLVIAGACGGPAPSAQPTSAGNRGGTLRIGVIGDDMVFDQEVYADPGRQTHAFFMRCCLARTLLTYRGETTTDGGSVLVPDLAERMPDVSRDGLTWTFHIRSGIKYAPPNDSIEVTSADFVTAVERSIRINAEVFPPYQIVAGTQEYLDRSSAGVVGLETPDAHTLVVRLVQPFGALNYLADVSWAPIPSSVAAGHDEDLGLYWPSTGPYTYEAYPADPAAPTAAYVRNEAWSSENDSTRAAFVDRIELSPVGEDPTAALANVESSTVDFLSQRLDEAAADKYRSQPATTVRVRSTPSEYLYQLPMNIAVPPFDDLAVRRSAAFALDRVAVRDAIVAALSANGTTRPPTVLSQHMFADSITGGVLLGYDPFTLGDGRGNLSRAKTEMAKSRYDSDADGVCNADVCSAISMPTFDIPAGEAVARSLAPLGLHVEPVLRTDENDIAFPTNRTAMAVLEYGWGFELSGAEMAVLVQGGEGLTADGFAVNASLVGARPEDLESWGYEITSVPTVDDVIDRCNREVGNRRARCWADFDQLVAETITPWVPLFAFDSIWVSSARVEQYALDQAAFQQFPALDEVTLVPEALSGEPSE